ncbi:hypothetical protein RhiirA5_452304 [Rhizophagus irregularis]|uniref:Crinkler effector protein N-terminal domain-containing protein n=1 Tax=Rhizophagus irregularis TaxID=588596 RepID=A0A2N0P8C4_9GLOM|nr:hypothetical protein RhiirA5_452304 [Rhizophagus irregularis]
MSIILNCLIVGDGLPDIFKVNIKKEETVGQLIKAIEETRDAGEIKLWKVNIPLAYNNKKLITLINDPIADAREFGGTKLSKKIKISSVFNNSNMSLDIIAEPRVSFRYCTNNKELVPGDLIKLDAREGMIEIKNGIPRICYNSVYFNSFKEFVQASYRHQQPNLSKETLKIYLHESKITINWQEFRRRVLHERKIKRDLCKLHEKEPFTSSQAREPSDTEYDKLADQASKFGLIREKFIDWICSISAELLSTQTLEYWLLSYVSETSPEEANFWSEMISPRNWLLLCFEINIETAIAIVNGVSENYLGQQTPRYWVEDWIKQLANKPSSEFKNFINNANANELTFYEHELYPTPILVVNKEPVSGDDNELRLLLQTELAQQADESTLFYHTTNLWGAENIITEGIDFGECRRRQDFGGRTVSYYLNNNFGNAIEFARQRVLNSPAIIVYHIPETLLEQHDHLNLSEDHRMWKKVVRHSRNGIRNVVDDYDSAYSPQATNGKKLIDDDKATPKASVDKNQLAIKSGKLSRKIDSQIVGVIIYKK